MMPTETFLRLPEEKRRRITEAALDEFSSYRFSACSINRIIKAAAIPRGSFYQYFTDKEDLYLYLLHIISKEKIDIFTASATADAQLRNLYQLLTENMPRIYDWALANPRYYRLGLLMLQDDSDFIRNILGKMVESQQVMLELLQQEQQAGLIRPELDVAVIMRLILTLASSLLNDFYQSKSKEEALASIDQVFNILCYGFLTEKAQNEAETR